MVSKNNIQWPAFVRETATLEKKTALGQYFVTPNISKRNVKNEYIICEKMQARFKKENIFSNSYAERKQQSGN